MTIPLGGEYKLNLSPCSPDDEIRNLQTQEKFNTDVIDAILNDSGIDTKVAVDVANVATPNYLNDQMYYDTSGGDIVAWPAVGLPVVADVTTAKERLRADFSQVPGYPADPADLDGNSLALKLVGNAIDGPSLLFETINDITDTNLVVVNGAGNDTTPKALHDAFSDNNAYTDGTDILVATETVEAGPADQHERLFVKVSFISEYSDTGFRVLGAEDNITRYFTADDFASRMFGGITLVGLTYADGTLTATAEGGTSTINKIGKADADIPGLVSASQAGSGTVSIWSIDGSGVLADTGVNETWYNVSATAVLASVGQFIHAKDVSGVMVIDYEDCSIGF